MDNFEITDAEDRMWNLLLVEDDEDDYVLVRAWLTSVKRNRFRLTWVTGYEAALEVPDQQELDAILVDYDLGAHTGLDLARELLQRGCQAPIILLTGRGSYAVDLEAMKAGVSDYLMKSEATPRLLERAIRYAIDRRKAEQALAGANRSLRNINLRLKQARDELEVRVAERTRDLQRANEELSFAGQLLANVNDAVIAVDTQGAIIAWNPAAEAIYGWTAEEALGQTARELLHIVWEEPYQEEMRRLATNGAFQGEALFRHKDGRPVYTEVKTTCLRDERGEVIGYVSVNRDVTQRKRMERELADVQRRLMERVEKERLELAQELHDGPMQELYGVIYQLEGLQRRITNPDQLEGLASAQDTLRHVLYSLRTAAGELRPPALMPYGLEKAIRSHAERLQQPSAELSVILELEPDGQLLPERVRLALFRIYQVAITNVVRHSRAKQVIVRLSLDEERVVLEVEDDGQGFVVPERLIDLARDDHLGLVGAAERAEANGGELQVHSQPGSGTLVRAILPRAEQQSVSGDE